MDAAGGRGKGQQRRARGARLRAALLAAVALAGVRADSEMKEEPWPYTTKAPATDKQGKEGTWTCGDGGFYHVDGVKTEYPCTGSKDETASGKDGATGKDGESSESLKDGAGCTNVDDPGMPAAFTKTCLDNQPPTGGRRCWWTYVPVGVSSPAALVIDMHGGGGCASHQLASSGFKELTDSLAEDKFVVVYPQGDNQQWGTCGADCDRVAAEGGGKSIHTTDDVTFLANLIAHITNSDSTVDAERVYATGFSMGCMMSHRLALERSDLLAGFGCHGGRLIGAGTDMAAQKTRFGLKPMPAYMTGGSADEWFAVQSYDEWSILNASHGHGASWSAL